MSMLHCGTLMSASKSTSYHNRIMQPIERLNESNAL